MSAPFKEYSLPDDDTTFEPEQDHASYHPEPSIHTNQEDGESLEREAWLEDDSLFDDVFLGDVTAFLEKGYMGLTASMVLFGVGNAARSYMAGDYSDLAVSLFISATGARFAADAYRACQKPSRQGRY